MKAWRTALQPKEHFTNAEYFVRITIYFVGRCREMKCGNPAVLNRLRKALKRNSQIFYGQTLIKFGKNELLRAALNFDRFT